MLGTNNTFIKEVCRLFPFCQHIVYARTPIMHASGVGEIIKRI